LKVIKYLYFQLKFEVGGVEIDAKVIPGQR